MRTTQSRVKKRTDDDTRYAKALRRINERREATLLLAGWQQVEPDTWLRPYDDDGSIRHLLFVYTTDEAWRELQQSIS